MHEDEPVTLGGTDPEEAVAGRLHGLEPFVVGDVAQGAVPLVGPPVVPAGEDPA